MLNMRKIDFSLYFPVHSIVQNYEKVANYRAWNMRNTQKSTMTKCNDKVQRDYSLMSGRGATAHELGALIRMECDMVGAI